MNDNRTTISVITTTIALIAVICVATECYLSYKGIQIPPELNTLTGGVTGALVAMLTKTSPTQSTQVSTSDPTPVVVTNKPADPVQTHETQT